MDIKKLNIRLMNYKEKISVLSIIIISIVLVFVIKDINKYRIFIHSTYAVCLISIGIIVSNTMKLNENKLSIFLGLIFTSVGVLQVIYVLILLNTVSISRYIYDLIAIISILSDLIPIVGIYISFSCLEESKEIYENLYITFLSGILCISFFVLFKNLSKDVVNIQVIESMNVYIEAIINIFIVLMGILINSKIKKIDNKLKNQENDFLKKVTIIIVLSRIPTLLHIYVKDLYIEDILKQIIMNITIYYLYKYIVNDNIKIPYIKLNEINNELIEKSNNLNDKNKKLIEETQKIKELKKNLNIENSKLQSTLDLSMNCIIVFNKNKEITYLNKSFRENFKKNNINKDYELELDIKPLLKNYDSFINSIDIVNNFNKEIENMIYTKSNKTYQSIFSPLLINKQNQGVLCILIDKTKRKEFEGNIIDINKRYESLLESIGDGIVVIQDGKRIYVNKACKAIFKDEIDKINFKIDYNNDNLEEAYYIDGKKIYVEMSFSKYCKNNENKIIIVIRDITSRKKSQLKLKESQKSYARLIDILPDGICLLNKNLDISYVNKSLLSMLKTDDILSLNIKKIMSLSVEEESIFERKMRKVINENKYMLLPEYELITYDKNKIKVEVNALPFSIDENKQIMLIIKDLTDKRISEIAEKELLDRVNIDKVKTEFFANMSHELKTPLNVISSSNQLIGSLYKNDKINDYNDNMKSHIGLVRQSSYRLQKLITNIIDLTKMESGFYKIKLSKYNIVNIVEDLFMKIDEYTIRKEINIIFDTNNEEINVNIDKIEMERIILNLLSNCIKFTNKGGCIFVNIYDKKESVIISVKDNGVGIPKDKKNIVFQEFAQVDRTLSRNTEGSGMGLTIVKNLVELHKGSINVESEEGKGTEFIINIPISDLSNEKCYEDKRIYNIDEKIKIEFSDIYY